MTMAAITVVPSLISSFDGLSRVWKQFSSIDFKSTFKTLKTGIESIGDKSSGPLGKAILGGGGLTMMFMAFTEKTPEIKAAYAIIGGVLLALAAKQWIVNIAQSMGIVLSTMGAAAWVVLAAGAAAAGTYILATMYGANPDDPATNIDAANSAADRAAKKYDGEGYDENGFNREGYNRQGYDKDGYNRSGVDIEGYDRTYGRKLRGYDANGNAVYDLKNSMASGEQVGPSYFEDSSGKKIYKNEYVDEARGIYKYDTNTYGTLAGSSWEAALARQNQINSTTNNFYVDGARDADLTAAAISAKLIREGGLKY
jgi:hypothetical protein